MDTQNLKSSDTAENLEHNRKHSLMSVFRTNLISYYLA